MSKRTDLHSPEAQAKRDRTATAEAKVKRLRVENDDLRRQLFRAQEATRLADEEALALRQSLASMTQSRDAARARNVVLQGRIDTLIERPVDPQHAATAPRPSLLQRLTGRTA